MCRCVQSCWENFYWLLAIIKKISSFLYTEIYAKTLNWYSNRLILFYLLLLMTINIVTFFYVYFLLVQRQIVFLRLCIFLQNIKIIRQFIINWIIKPVYESICATSKMIMNVPPLAVYNEQKKKTKSNTTDP